MVSIEGIWSLNLNERGSNNRRPVRSDQRARALVAMFDERGDRQRITKDEWSTVHRRQVGGCCCCLFFV